MSLANSLPTMLFPASSTQVVSTTNSFPNNSLSGLSSPPKKLEMNGGMTVEKTFELSMFLTQLARALSKPSLAPKKLLSLSK